MAAPDQIKFRGARYVLVEGKKGKRDQSEDVFAKVRLRGKGVSFYINILVRAKDLKDMPFTRQVRAVPDSVNLTADQLDEALTAKKAGELWHIYAEGVGWYWGEEDADASKVADIQKVLDLLNKYKKRARNPVIFAEVANKLVG